LNKHRAFIPLKDAHGTTQLIVDVKKFPALAGFTDVPPESVVHVEGTVLARPESQVKPVSLCIVLHCLRDRQADSQGLAGDIELAVERFTVLNPASRDMPFLPSVRFNLVRLRYVI
jgi:aspartyl-tRNA synthetase